MVVGIALIIIALAWVFLPSDFGGGWLEASPLVYITENSPHTEINNLTYYYATPSYKPSADTKQCSQYKCSLVSKPLTWFAVFGNHTLQMDFEEIRVWGITLGLPCPSSGGCLMRASLILSGAYLDDEKISVSGSLGMEATRLAYNRLDPPRTFSFSQQGSFSTIHRTCNYWRENGEIGSGEAAACEQWEDAPILTKQFQINDIIAELKMTYKTVRANQRPLRVPPNCGRAYWEGYTFEIVFYIPEHYIIIEPSPEPFCGDGICDPDETCASCAQDCGTCPPPPPTCGDGTCNGDETCESCPTDCGACVECVVDEDCPVPLQGDELGTWTCESGTCQWNPTPLPSCGDGICQAFSQGESCLNCPGDCGCPIGETCNVNDPMADYKGCVMGGGGGDEPDYLIWALIGGILVVIALIIIVAVRKNG